VLERTQKGNARRHRLAGVVPWGAGTRLSGSAHTTLDAVLVKARFWQRWAGTPLNERQVKVLNRALDGLEGKLTSSKWASLAKCSPDTALRDITQLLDLGVLTRAPGGGRSTAYELAGG
jgi:Fic family protein